MNISARDRRTAFSIWLRTGRWPRAEAARTVEVKFNPWHDPTDGRFTFAGSGRNYSGGHTISGSGSRSAPRQRQDVPKVEYVEDLTLPTVKNMEEVEVWRSSERAQHAGQLDYLKAIEVQYQRYKADFATAASLQALGKFSASSSGGNGDIGGGFGGGGGDFGGGGATGSWEDGKFAGGDGSFGGGGATGSWTDGSFTGRGGSASGGGATGSWTNGTFTGGGGSFGGGGATGSWGTGESTGRNGNGFSGAGASSSWRASPQTGRPGKPVARGGFRGAGATGTWSQSSPSRGQGSGFSGGGGSIGGAGATGSWSEPASRTSSSPSGGRSGSQTGVAPRSQSEQRYRFVRNGYEYQVDTGGRMREASGTLASDTEVRSRKAQREAGGPDRRKDDDGGHYIAARFNGPTDAFNHFAQNANFNRGNYRKLEDQWAQAQRAGKRVTVRIVPHYEGTSQRPSTLDVWFTINGRESSLKFPNEHQGKNNAKR
jgi:hypothetical protein